MSDLPTCEHYDEMWEAILAKCEELIAAARPCRGYSTSQAMIHGDGHGVSRILSVGRPDGTDTVYHVQACHYGRRSEPEIMTEAWLDSHDAFWAKELADRSNAVVIDHEHYRIQRDLSPGDRDLAGYSGHLFRIRMLASGEVTETRNLWHQGTIPPSWRDRLPDTAEFFNPESECSSCGQRITQFGTIWTAADGTSGCTGTPRPYSPHCPKEAEQ